MRRRFNLIAPLLCLLLTVCVVDAAIAVDALVLEAEQQRVATIERISAPTIAIFNDEGNNGGSGVLIRPNGLAVTNFHVVEGLGPFMKCGLNDGNVYEAVIIGIDPTGDVALVQLLGRDDFPAAEVGDSDAVRMGDWVYVVGNPFLLATDFTPTVTYGIVSGTHRYQYPAKTLLEYTDCIQVDASINPGNSGGPLFNADGQLIGINGRASFEKRGRVNIGAGYAISINQVMHFLDHLHSGRIVDHATLGATVTSESDGSVTVDQILPQSEAYRRGLRRGDEIVSFAGRPIGSVNQFKNILGIFPDGWKRPLVYRRDGEKHEIMVRLRPLHSRSELVPAKPKMPHFHKPEGDSPDDEESPERPMPDIPPGHPLAHLFKQTRIPEEYAELYEEREGFANYRFNRVARERIYDEIDRLGEFPAGSWKVAGVTSENVPFQFQLNDEVIALTMGQESFLQNVGEAFRDEPPVSGGLLAAMHHFRLMLIDPEERFTEFYYVGSEPLDGDGEKVDVLIATRGSTTSRWYFRQSDSTFIGYDTEIEPDTDACEVRIVEWQAIESLTFPAVISVRHLGEQVGEMTIESFSVKEATP
ncbi:MAG: trypsin-like peptidase domain-containing protein [Planctomycetaceae bacterium]|nr:trypsin-like peptidase domain-containing protein [Planctomycetaceae bacterium]